MKGFVRRKDGKNRFSLLRMGSALRMHLGLQGKEALSKSPNKVRSHSLPKSCLFTCVKNPSLSVRKPTSQFPTPPTRSRPASDRTGPRPSRGEKGHLLPKSTALRQPWCHVFDQHAHLSTCPLPVLHLACQPAAWSPALVPVPDGLRKEVSSPFGID